MRRNSRFWFKREVIVSLVLVYNMTGCDIFISWNSQERTRFDRYPEALFFIFECQLQTEQRKPLCLIPNDALSPNYFIIYPSMVCISLITDRDTPIVAHSIAQEAYCRDSSRNCSVSIQPSSYTMFFAFSGLQHQLRDSICHLAARLL